MASSTPLTNNQAAPPRGQDSAVGAAPAIEPRGIATPQRMQARRKGQDGAVGSQKATRYALNAAHWRTAGARDQGDKTKSPITKATTLSILQRAREILRR